MIQKGFVSVAAIVSVVVIFVISVGAVLYFNKNGSDKNIPVYSPPTSNAPDMPALAPAETKKIEVKTTVAPDVAIRPEYVKPADDQSSNTPVPTSSPIQTQTTATPTPEICSNDPPVLVADITDFYKITKITAPGSPSSEGPKGHSFIWTEHQKMPIYAPVDMILDSGSYSKDTADSPAQYLLFFKVKNSCSFQIKFDHIDEPTDSIKQNFSSTPAVGDSSTSFVADKVELKAGDLVGHTSGTLQAGNWDFGLYNTAQKGALADSYGIHAYSVCWVDYYSQEKQGQYRALLEGPKLVCSF